MPGSLTLNCGSSRTEPTDTVINGVTVRGTGFPHLFGNLSLTNTFCKIAVGYSDTRVVNSSIVGFKIQRNWGLVNACNSQTLTWLQTIDVRDAPPTLSLKQNVIVQIPTSKRIEVTANELIENLTDDCTARTSMVLGIRRTGTGTGFPSTSSLFFVCGDQGIVNVEIWIKDEAGNTSRQTTPLSIKDDAGNCILPSISGMIQRENATDVPSRIMLYNSVNNAIDSITGVRYNFTGLPPNNSYTIMPTRPNTDWLNGVTMFDVALLSRHLLGVESLASPYRMIGADVNHDGELDAADMLLTQRLILHITSAFPNNNSWRFILKNYVFVDPTNPFSVDFPEIYRIPNLTTAISNGDFVAIKVGDINMSAGSVNIRGRLKPFILSVEDKVLEKNKTYNIPIRLMPFQKDYKGEAISALQFALNLDKKAVAIEATAKGDLPNCTENNTALFKNEGIATAAWYRAPQQHFIETDTFTMFNLTIKVLENTRLSQVLSLDPTFTEGVAYDEVGDGAAVKLSFGNTDKPSMQAILLPNRPNPFREETTISFILPENGFAKLMVYDLLGKVLMTTEKVFSKGLNEVIFNTKDNPSVSSGILVVRLQTEQGVLEQKIVLSR